MCIVRCEGGYSPTCTPKTQNMGCWHLIWQIQHSGAWLLSPTPPISLSCPTFLFQPSLSPSFSPSPTHTVQQPPLGSASKAPGSSEHRCRTAGLQPTGPGCWNRRGEPAHMQNYNASISHTDIIPMFYLSPCNSFYILGLCSLASIQSQPRDTGLYQAHMCALLQLTHISSFVTVTKLARLSWEMCRLWLTAHVWILYFESHADLSNTGSVKASLTLLSSTGTTESCRGFAALTTHLWITLHSLYVCVKERMNIVSQSAVPQCCFYQSWVSEACCWHVLSFPREKEWRKS